MAGKKAKPVKKSRARKAPSSAKRAAKPVKAAVRKPAAEAVKVPERRLIGEVTHYFTHINVAVVKLSDTLRRGEKILIQGATTNMEQTVNSMQIEHASVEVARPGDSIGLKVADRVREGDRVFRV
jgi:translation elongation factor EF-1alpha